MKFEVVVPDAVSADAAARRDFPSVTITLTPENAADQELATKLWLRQRWEVFPAPEGGWRVRHVVAGEMGFHDRVGGERVWTAGRWRTFDDAEQWLVDMLDQPNEFASDWTLMGLSDP